ncbi:MAG TPA: hypothetical protein VEZ11_07260 [Thermoanaerobaculia bacterium]|nr:hypothetical protein [Thermoanaerobaculia bacterium]
MELHACILCERTSDEVPLVVIEYRGSTLHICSQHLPVLIHNPAELAERMPGVEKLKGPGRVL